MSNENKVCSTTNPYVAAYLLYIGLHKVASGVRFAGVTEAKTEGGKITFDFEVEHGVSYNGKSMTADEYYTALTDEYFSGDHKLYVDALMSIKGVMRSHRSPYTPKLED